MPEAAVSFFGALAGTGYMLPLLFAAQVAGGAAVLAGMAPLGLVILAPIIVNIVAFHLFLAPAGLPLALVVAAAAAFLAWAHRASYAALFAPGVARP
jgi:putative oxidoreductase